MPSVNSSLALRLPNVSLGFTKNVLLLLFGVMINIGNSPSFAFVYGVKIWAMSASILDFSSSYFYGIYYYYVFD